jgi:chromosome segregation ATPase
VKGAYAKHDAVIQEMAAHKHQHSQEIDELNKTIENLTQEVESLKSSAGDQGLIKKYEEEIAQLKEKVSASHTEIEEIKARHAKELDDSKNFYEGNLQNKLDASVIDELKENHFKELQKTKNELEAEIEQITSHHHQSIKDLRECHAGEIQEMIKKAEDQQQVNIISLSFYLFLFIYLFFYLEQFIFITGK